MIAALKLAKISSELQLMIYDEFNDILDNKTIMEIDINQRDDDILFALRINTHKKLEKVVINVPAEYVNEVKKLIEKFLKEKTLR